MIGAGRIEAMLACQRRPFIPHMPQDGTIQEDPFGAGFLIAKCIFCEKQLLSTEMNPGGVPIPKSLGIALKNRLWLDPAPETWIITEEP